MMWVKLCLSLVISVLLVFFVNIFVMNVLFGCSICIVNLVVVLIRFIVCSVLVGVWLVVFVVIFDSMRFGVVFSVFIRNLGVVLSMKFI